MRNEVQGIIKSMIQGLNGIGAQVADIYRQNPDTMTRGLQIDFVHFILYLAGADGEFTESENKFIKEYFDMDLTIDNWKEYSSDLEFDINKPKIPMTFEFFIKADNVQYSSDRNVGNACESFISCFKSVGEVFLGADGEVSDEEIERLRAYINLMQNFYEENTDRTNINKPEPIDVDFAKKVTSPKKESKGEVTTNNTVSQSCKYITVKFLDKTYDIPEDAVTFLYCRDFVSNGLIKLLNESSRLLNKYSRMKSELACKSLDTDANQIQRTMLSIIEEVKKDLISRGIYDVDEYDLGANITAVKEVENLATAVVLEMYSSVLEIHNENEAYRNSAYRSAASNITGSGVRIYTNSFSALMMHSAVENSILKSQAKKADKEYEDALRRINSRTEDRFDRMFSDALYNKFLPGLPAIYTLFHDELLKVYLLELAQHGRFNIDNIERYSENKSSTMLENMKHATDKRTLLIQAYEMCPFNIEVYEKMIKLGFFDVETMKDAKKIFKVSELSGLLEEKIKDNLKKPDVIKDYITVLADYKGVSETDILKTFYQSTISRIKNAYHELFLLCADSKRLDKWIMEKINSDMDKVVTTSEEDVRSKVDSWIQRNVEDSEFTELSNMGLITIEDIRMKDSTITTLEDVKTEYANAMVSRIMDYIKEAKVRKVAYEEAYDKFNAELKKKSDALDSKMAELKQQGMFAFSKKKEIKAEIEQLQRDLDDFRKTEPVKLREAYYGMYA